MKYQIYKSSDMFYDEVIESDLNLEQMIHKLAEQYNNKRFVIFLLETGIGIEIYDAYRE